MALQGHKCQVKAQSSAVAMTDEATTGAGDLVYTITDTAKTIMDLNTAVIVKDGGTATSEKYTLDRLNGAVTFSTAVSRVITVSGAYVTPVVVATADGFSFTATVETLKNTPFHVDFETFQAGLLTGTATLSRFFVVDDLFIDQLLDGEYKIIEYFVDATHKISFYGLISSEGIESPVDGLVMETVNYQVTNQMGLT